MTTHQSNVKTLYWDDDQLQLLDQRRLPSTVEYFACATVEAVIDAIKNMVVRGAPAIGVSAAYGAVLAARDCYRCAGNDWRDAFEPLMTALSSARPTAVNLAWACDIMSREARACGPGDPEAAMLAAARRLHEQDLAANQAMGDLGSRLLKSNAQVITHCNAGALATAGYGTALGVIRSAFRDGRLRRVFATETRPWLQGARLTAWELQADSIPVTLIADDAAAQLMSRESIDWVITGADRVAANGDVANKIGTYTLALCARALGTKFMVAAPLSTIDLDTPDGGSIPIELRDPAELLAFQNHPTAPPGLDAYNPVFDVTPADLVDVLVTEKGVIEKPDKARIARLF